MNLARMKKKQGLSWKCVLALLIVHLKQGVPRENTLKKFKLCIIDENISRFLKTACLWKFMFFIVKRALPKYQKGNDKTCKELGECFL